MEVTRVVVAEVAAGEDVVATSMVGTYLDPQALRKKAQISG